MFISDVFRQLGRKQHSYQMFSSIVVENSFHIELFQGGGKQLLRALWRIPCSGLKVFEFLSSETFVQIQKSNARPKLQIDSLRENFCLTLHANTLVVKSISDVFNKKICKTFFTRGPERAFGTLQMTLPQRVLHTHVNPSLNPRTGVLRQGDGRGPANGDFISFLPWISWENDEHWYGLGKCLFIDADPVAGKPNRSGMWNDATCSHRYKYICERTVPPQM